MPRTSVISFAPLTVRGLLRHLPLIALCAMLAAVSAQPLLAATATTTTLVVSPTAITPGKPAKLVATVKDPSSKSVFPGTVNFYDGTRLLGSAQIVSHTGGVNAEGTATLNIASFDAGDNSITAVFAGTKAYLSSTSAAETLTVTGQYPTSTLLATSGTSGHYDLTATVDTFGAAPPTGNIDFFNDTTGISLGSVSLSGAKPAGGSFVLGSSQPGLGYTTPGFTVGDFNGDGLLDAAIVSGFVVQSQAGGVGIYLGKGDGTFAAPNFYYPGSTLALHAGDFNNDGNLDLMGFESGYPNSHSGAALLYLGNGDGTFQPPVQLGLDQNGNGCIASPSFSAVADFDRDGNLDVVVTGLANPAYGSGGNALCVLRGNGDGTFKTPQTLSLLSGSPFEPVAVGDLNGDKVPDLVIFSDTTAQVLLGNANGTFKKLPVDASLAVGSSLALGDLNGDGNLDLAVTAGIGIDVSFGNGDGTFGPATSYSVPDGAHGLAILDLNRDGKPDIAVADYSSGISYTPVLLGNGDGTFESVSTYPGFGGYPTLLVPGDFNGDGLPDLLVNGSNESSLVLLTQKGSSVTLHGANLPGPGTSSVFAQYSGDSLYTPSTSCQESPGVKPEFPTQTNIYPNHITSTTASIAWTSNFPTNGYVGYGTSYKYQYLPDRNPYPLFPENTPWQHDATTFHFVTLTGLIPGTVYFFAPTSVGYFSGCHHWSSTSTLRSFTTPAP